MEKDVAQDNRTLSFYAQEAAAYTSRDQAPSSRRIETFLSMLPAGATILELGCGAGQDGRDQFGRYYNYPSKSWLNDMYAGLPWEKVTIEADQGSGYDQKPTDWLHVTAIKQR